MQYFYTTHLQRLNNCLVFCASMDSCMVSRQPNLFIIPLTNGCFRIKIFIRGTIFSGAKVVLQSLATQPIAPIIRDSIYEAKHSFSALTTLLPWISLSRSQGKLSSHFFTVLILATMAKKNFQLTKHSRCSFVKQPYEKHAQSSRSSLSLAISMAISHVVYFKPRAEKLENWGCF